MQLSSVLTQDVRQVLWAMLSILIFSIPTIDSVRAANPERVEDIGALMAIWALVSITINRARYTQAIADWEKAKLDYYMKNREAQDRFLTESLNLTFDLHACQIAQMSAHIGVPNPWCEPDEDALREMAHGVQHRLKKGEHWGTMQASNARKISEFQVSYDAKVPTLRNWDSFLGKFEIPFAIWGILQGACGSELVAMFH